MSLGGYSTRTSYIGGGNNRADPGINLALYEFIQPVVLSSFSPVGSSRLKDDISVIVPRTATPLQSSSMAHTMVSASDTEVINENIIKRIEDKTSEGVGRLSISGRLSMINKTPIQKGDSWIDSFESKELLKSETITETNKLSESFRNSDTIRDRFSISKEKIHLEPLPLSSSTQPQSSTNVLNSSITDVIKTLVEKSIVDSVSELRNDIQNLHVDLIKHTLAQQSMLKQIIGTMPDAYKKLSDDYQNLKDENERLKARLSNF